MIRACADAPRWGGRCSSREPDSRAYDPSASTSLRAEGRRTTVSTTSRILTGNVVLRTTPQKDLCDPESDREWEEALGGGLFAVGFRLGGGRPTGGAAAIICAGNMSLNDETVVFWPGAVGTEGIVGNRRIGSLSARTRSACQSSADLSRQRLPCCAFGRDTRRRAPPYSPPSYTEPSESRNVYRWVSES